MRILHILGNGFDLNLGLKTRYQDFYEYYNKKDSNNGEAIKLLKQSIDSDLENWADLELALGEYTSILQSHVDLESIVFDITNELCIYLEQEQRKIDAINIDRAEFFNDLINPERHLSRRDRSEIQSQVGNSRNAQQVSLNIITLNYTSTIEQVFEGKTSGVELGVKTGKKVILSKIEHLHGRVYERPILGVNDIEQIGNKKFHDLEDTVELLVKPLHNQALGHMVDDDCVKHIKQSNIICIFGCSIGETDRKWWAAIGDRIGENCPLMIVHRAEDFHPRQSILGPRAARAVKKRFLSMTNLSEQEKQAAMNYIYVAINSEMFRHDEIA